MDMQLDKNKLRAEREQRAWSQSHLAEVAGLSLRTVQRLERNGAASLESARALAAAFDTQVEQLRELAVTPQLKTADSVSMVSGVLSRVKAKTISVGLLVAGLVLASTGLIWWSKAVAEPIMINLLVASENKTLADVKLVNTEGEISDVVLDERLKFKVASSRVDGGVMLTTKIYEFTNNQFELVAEPALLCAHNQASAIHFSAANGKEYRLLFRVN